MTFRKVPSAFPTTSKKEEVQVQEQQDLTIKKDVDVVDVVEAEAEAEIKEDNNAFDEEGDVGGVMMLYHERYVPKWFPVLILAFPIAPLFWSYKVEIKRRCGNEGKVGKGEHLHNNDNKNHNDNNLEDLLTLRFGYSTILSSKTVDCTPEKIKSVAPIEHLNGFYDFGGWGIRYRPSSVGWQIGYIAKNGGAVQITLWTTGKETNDVRKSERTYVFSCDNPHKVCDIINKHITANNNSNNKNETK